MAESCSERSPGLSIILPASNEAALIGACLEAVLASRWTRAEPVEVIVVANGCKDDTAARAHSFSDRFTARGWGFCVLDLVEGGKLFALNAGDAKAQGATRLYLDADVTVSPDLLSQIADTLETDAPRYASGAVRIVARGWVSRAYARIWRQVPFMAHGVPGCGVFAVNAPGRARWGTFPQIISDDTFVRLSFAPLERHGVPAPYDWPIAEGFGALVRVRRRQDAGVEEIERLYPDLLYNDDKPAFPLSQKLGMALRDPLGFMVYSAVALAVKLTKSRASGWSRGR
jgi:glycosyltransferase involved in cell wall biosynthesis